MLAADALLGECPLWSTVRQVLYWIDIEGQRVHIFDPAAGTDTAIPTPGRPGSIALTEDENRLLITLAGEERGRNEIQIGGGYSGLEGAFFSGVYSTRNFLGRGQIRWLRKFSSIPPSGALWGSGGTGRFFQRRGFFALNFRAFVPNSSKRSIC